MCVGMGGWRTDRRMPRPTSSVYIACLLSLCVFKKSSGSDSCLLLLLFQFTREEVNKHCLPQHRLMLETFHQSYIRHLRG